jgi:hypothetical protein
MNEPSDPAREPLWHGYSYTDIDDIARLVIRVDRYRKDMDTTERYLEVRFAIIEFLATATDRPSHQDLVGAGRHGSDAHVRSEMHTHGWDRRRLDLGSGALPGFHRFWQDSGRMPMDERVVERIAVRQVWPTLTLAQQQAVMALALTDDHVAAARQLGIPYGNYASRLRNARIRFHALWHEHETPRRPRRDKRVLNRVAVDSRGKRRLTESEVEVLRDRVAAGEKQYLLAAEVGYTPGALSYVLRGRRRAAPDVDASRALLDTLNNPEASDEDR